LEVECLAITVLHSVLHSAAFEDFMYLQGFGGVSFVSQSQVVTWVESLPGSCSIRDTTAFCSQHTGTILDSKIEPPEIVAHMPA